MPTPLQPVEALASIALHENPDVRDWANLRLTILDPKLVRATSWFMHHLPHQLELSLDELGRRPALAGVQLQRAFDAGLFPSDEAPLLARLRAELPVAGESCWTALVRLGATTAADLRSIIADLGEAHPVTWAAVLQAAEAAGAVDSAAQGLAQRLVQRVSDALDDESAHDVVDTLAALNVPLHASPLRDMRFEGAPADMLRRGAQVARGASGGEAVRASKVVGSPATDVLRTVTRALQGVPGPAAGFLRALARHRECAGLLATLLPVIGWLSAFTPATTDADLVRDALHRGDVADPRRLGRVRRALVREGLPEGAPETDWWVDSDLYDLPLTGPAGRAYAERLAAHCFANPTAPSAESWWAAVGRFFPEVALAALQGPFAPAKATFASMLPWEEALALLLEWEPSGEAERELWAVALIETGDDAGLSRVQAAFDEIPEAILPELAFRARLVGAQSPEGAH